VKKDKKKNKKKQTKKALDIPNYRLEQSEKIEITANSGMFLLAELLKKIDFCEYFSKLNIFSRKKIDESIHILALIINQFTGGEAIYDTRHVKEDGALLKIFGDIHIPAPHTSGDFLGHFTEDMVERLRAIIHQMQDKQLKKLSKRLKGKIVISCDSSIYEIHGNGKEKSSFSYKGIFGFHPLFLHIQDTGELLDIQFRAGSSYTSKDVVSMLERNILRLQPYFSKIVLLADSGFFEQAVVNFCERDDIGIEFIITSEINAPIRKRLESQDINWTELAIAEEDSEKAHRDSHTFNYRLHALKQALKKCNRVLKIRGEVEVSEFEHTVPAWGKTYRFVFKRQLLQELDLSHQYRIFDDNEVYFYHGYVTNISDKSIKEILALIHSRGHQENFIKDFKHGLGTVHIPVKYFYGNYAYFLISMLSWNLKCWLLYIIEPDLNIYWKRFRYLFIKVGAQIIKASRYVIIRFGRNFDRVDEFIKWFSRLQEPIFE